MGWASETLDPLRSPTRSLRQEVPDQWAAFAQTHRATFSDGALSVATKELMAVAIAVAQQCDGCIAAHVRAAVTAGATREEVAEALTVALFMTGGPGSIYAPRAWAAYEEYAPEPAKAARAAHTA
ncbi:MAG TPA: carboxymuconolactone decarboxylase family protein [Jiangellales bacterium]|nr:carboxymuconolactone decarboxylase family protein [Jiangellales bacterium]